MTEEITKNNKTMTGEIVSDKMDKTVVVSVSRFVKHPKYGKYTKRSKNFKAHDENNEYKTGERVTIEETVPYSKSKKFKVVGKTK